MAVEEHVNGFGSRRRDGVETQHQVVAAALWKRNPDRRPAGNAVARRDSFVVRRRPAIAVEDAIALTGFDTRRLVVGDGLAQDEPGHAEVPGESCAGGQANRCPWKAAVMARVLETRGRPRRSTTSPRTMPTTATPTATRKNGYACMVKRHARRRRRST